MDTYRQILNRYWGFSGFKPKQEEIIHSVGSGKDTLALMPTGGGKSVTFQVPAIAQEGICIVVTPLIALMKDQVESLSKRGIKSMAVFSGMTRQEIDVSLDNCVYGNYKFLYVSPERLGTEMFRERVRKMKVNIIAVDEAHCISQWGYDFRPAYLKIAELRDLLPDAPVLALTATATGDVIKDIQEKLRFRSPNVIRTGFERKNLIYRVEVTEDKHRQLLDMVKKIPGSGIIYARNRRKTVELAKFLENNGIKAGFYHAGIATETRSTRQNDWMSGKIDVIVATNAFGMGIDKADVRYVVHFDLPDTLENYFQEAGRAGRDGKISFAVMFYNADDKVNAERRIETRFPDISLIRKVYQALGSYFQIPYGGGKDAVLNFNIMDFASFYKFNVMASYYSLKALETEGYLELTNEISNPSRIHFIIGRDDLYRFQVANAAFDAFIKLLLRSYSGVFNGFVAIDESYLAKKSSTTREVIYQYLVRLNKLKVIQYIPQRRSPLIIMNSERLDENSLFISASSYKARKDNYTAKQNYVHSYVSPAADCRSLFLLRYFGDEDAGKCGNCDLCTGNSSAEMSQYEFNLIRGKIYEIIRHGKVTVDELVGMLEDSPEKTLKVVRWLLDNSQITKGMDNVLKLLI